ncbi:MAG: class I SAM-dependent methyltransferase [Candidatus Gorgyraea atricola]|nr:class I SAM-dependent methyltransferase [Candidatus Gorgyraea atricola]
MKTKYETVSQCNLCESIKNRVVDERGHIVQCENCGLRFVNLRLTQDAISTDYDHSYVNIPGWGKVDAEAQLMYKRRADFLNRFIQRGRILDVAAGLGEFLSHVKKTGRWECLGTETSRYAIEFIKKEFGIELSFGQLEGLRYPDGFFDAVCFWHALEHMPDPSIVIKEAWRILKDNGFLFIAVPNDSWLGRRHFFKNALRKVVNHMPLKRKLKIKKMYPEIDEEGNKHLFYFTPRTLTRLLKKYGFKVRARSVDYDYGKPDPKLERRYRFDVLFCRFTGLNISNAILIAAQKKS